MSERGDETRRVGWWLLASAALVLVMVFVGGVVRLERAGLSIVEWAPVRGVLPPLGEQAWAEAFARYQQTPEARLVHTQITVDGFRHLFLLEWAHRLAARMVGLCLVAPVAVMALRRRLPRADVPIVLTVLGLAAVQAALGWWMVKSGLSSEPRVSPIRLAVHLSAALALLSILVIGATRRLTARPIADVGQARRASAVAAGLVGATAVFGAFVAGNRAGTIAPSFPLMAATVVPPDLWALDGVVENLWRNPVTVQFFHRLLAFCTVGAVGFVGLQLRFARGTVPHVAGRVALASCAVQLVLGALLVTRGVPVPLASLHQVNGAVLLASLVALWASLSPSPSLVASELPQAASLQRNG